MATILVNPNQNPLPITFPDTGSTTTLQDAYDNGTAGSRGLIVITAAGGGIVIRDPNPTAGVALFSVVGPGATNTYLGVGATGAVTLSYANGPVVTVGQNLTFLKEQGAHTISIVDSTTSGVAGDNLNIQAASATAGNADGGTIDLVPGAPSGSGVYGGIGIGRTQSYSITIGKYTLTGTGRTVQTFIRGSTVNIDGGDGTAAGGINITTDSGDIVINPKTTYIARINSATFLSSTSAALAIGSSMAAPYAITMQTVGVGAFKLLTGTGELQLDSAAVGGVRIGTGAAGAATTALEIGAVGVSTLTIVGAAALNGMIIDQHLTFKKGDGVTHTLSPQASTSGNGSRMNLYSGDANGANDTYLDIDTGVGGGRADLFIGQTNCKELNFSRAAGKIGFFAATAVVQQDTVEALTNNVTAGGTTGTIADYTDLTIYANDAAAIRNNFYQIARKLKQVDDALFAYRLVKHS